MSPAQSNEIRQFNFEGLDQDRIGYHPEHGAFVQANSFIKWLGFKNVKTTIDDYLQPGDFVKGYLTATPKRKQRVTILTKRGVRRLLFRSNKPLALKYADQVLDMLDELDRTGMVVDEKRITIEQIDAGRAKLNSIARTRMEEMKDYKWIRNSLKAGGAETSSDYARVQDTLYLLLFGKTARQIVATQSQRTGIPLKNGEGFRKSTAAKDFLTESQLALLKSAVLATAAQIELKYPDGATVDQMIDAIHRSVSLIQLDQPGQPGQPVGTTYSRSYP